MNAKKFFENSSNSIGVVLKYGTHFCYATAMRDMARLQKEKAGALHILIAGDVHGFFSGLQAAIARHAPDLVLQCGDFGYLPRLDMFPPERGFRDKKGRLVPVHFCDGNHDDCKSLRRLAGGKMKACEIAPGIFYQPRGSILELPGGTTVLFAGGAASVEKPVQIRPNACLP